MLRWFVAGTAALMNDEEVDKDENCKDGYDVWDICGWFVVRWWWIFGI
jgi:hypothetical protein